MATADRLQTYPVITAAPLVPVGTADQEAQRRQRVLELLESWETEGDEHEQRETLAVLRDALGPKRTASSRSLFP
jgi:hypothetical protein